MAQKVNLFIDMYYLELWKPLCLTDRNHLCNCNRYHEEQLCKIIWNMDQWFRRKCRLKVCLWQPFCSMERNYLCIFGRGYYERRYCEIILNFGSVVQEEMSSKIFIIWSYCGSPVQWSETIYAFCKRAS